MNIATIIGARPQFIKAALISEKINSINSLSEIIIHTGQHFDGRMSSIFFDEMNIPQPNYNLNINQLSYGQMIEKMVKKLNPILLEEKIHGVMVYGDTNSTLAGSISANKLNIPIFHVEAGLRSFNRSMLEENNRIITDHLSSLLFCPSENSVKNLFKEKLTDGVMLSGDVMYDIYLKYSSYKYSLDDDLKKSKYILATIHRRENINCAKKLTAIFNNLNKINEEQKIIMPLHPHTKQKIEEYEIQSNIVLIEPLGYTSMLSLLNECEIVITDSGGLQKEAYFAKKKCLTVRDETEWIELIEENANLLCAPENISHSFNKLINQKCNFSKNLYGNGKASALIIESIIDFLS
ncbi:MAG: non-hydrolyzing UDP-N-acetylglucosamine 2-epimerase [Candidatus Neomarinimicrobiota bacterium]